MALGPKNAAEEKIFAVERLRVDVQQAIHRLMMKTNTSEKELAQRLGVTEARINHIFDANCNITITFLAKVFHALGDRCEIMSESELKFFATKSKQIPGIHK